MPCLNWHSFIPLGKRVFPLHAPRDRCIRPSPCLTAQLPALEKKPSSQVLQTTSSLEPSTAHVKQLGTSEHACVQAGLEWRSVVCAVG